MYKTVSPVSTATEVSIVRRIIATYLSSALCLMSLLPSAATRVAAQTNQAQTRESRTATAAPANNPIAPGATPRGSVSRADSSQSGAPRMGTRARRPAAARGRRKPQYVQAQRSSATPQVSPAATQPVALVSPTSAPEYLFGQARVTVRAGDDPVIRLGITKHGPVVVEFIANDNFYAVHPGGSYLVTYDKTDTLATDHYLVFRAGEGFIAPPENSARALEPIASISVQMQSGVFVTLLFYPVSSVARMAHHCTVSYSREEVVAARRAAGLAVNLDGREPAAAPAAPASQRVTPVSNGNVISAGGTTEAASTDAGASAPARPSGAEMILASGNGGERSTKRRRSSKKDRDVVGDARDALTRAVKTPNVFTGWSPLAHGLSVATLSPIEVDDRRSLAVVAVRNTTTVGLRLLPGQPELDIQTLDANSRPVQIQPVDKLHTETSSLAAVIPAGATIYHVIVYQTPTLGAQQRLRLTVAHTEAADEPVSIDLNSSRARAVKLPPIRK